jgi:sugar phosphate isomerase/epimerase
MLQVLAEIDRPNFGLIYEPANLLLCGQSYGRDTIERLAPHLMNVYVQNHRLDAQGQHALATFCRGTVRYRILDPWEAGGIDFGVVTSGLKGVGYRGYFTVHQAQAIDTAAAARAFTARCANLFRAV